MPGQWLLMSFGTGQGADARGTVPGAGVPPRARRPLRRAELRRGPRRAAAAGTVRAAAARVARRADPPGRRREQLAAAGRGHVPGPLVLPLLRAGEEQRADDPGLAVLARRRAGTRPHVLDPAAGRG